MSAKRWPAWAVRQSTPAGLAITAERIAHQRAGPLGGWPTPPGCDDLEVFPARECAERATPADYTRLIVDD